MSVREKAEQLLSGRGWIIASLYAAVVVGMGGSLLAYAFLVPRSMDIGTAVAARALAYGASFQKVEQAREALSSGNANSAERTLLKFLRQTEKVQRSQLHSHAVAEAYELLSEIYLSAGKPGKAAEQLSTLTERSPLHHRAWFLRGQAERAGGDLESARESLDRAFRLSLVDVEVVEAYLQVLDEQGDYAGVLWVEDQFRRAERRAAPTAVVKVGVTESRLQSWVLGKVGIPIEHGRFFRGFETRGLPRGDARSFASPSDLFKDWPVRHQDLVIQICFEHVETLTVDKVSVEMKNGEVREKPLGDAHVRYLHRRHSAGEFYAEFGLGIPGSEVASLKIFYSVPSPALSESATAILEKAHANLSWQGAAC